MPASTISLDRAKQDKLFYMVANVVVYRESDGRCLILKRSDREIAHPGRYGVIGGKLEWADMDLAHPMRVNGDVLDYPDAVERLLAREAQEEAGIAIAGPLKYVNSVAFVRPDGIPVLLVKFAARHASGEAKPGVDFSAAAWVNADEVARYECIDGIADEVRQTIALFEAQHAHA